MKKLVLAIFLIFLIGCSIPEVIEDDNQVDIPGVAENYGLEFTNEGIFVKNFGNSNITKFTIDFETRWFDSFELGPNDIGGNFSRDYETNLVPGEQKKITTLFDALPDERLETRAHHIYYSNLKLKNTITGQVYQERFFYFAYQEGLNPWEDDIYLVREDSYEQIRQAIVDYNNQKGTSAE